MADSYEDEIPQQEPEANETEPANPEPEMAESGPEGEALGPTIREQVHALQHRIGEVMSKKGKRPGTLVALQRQLAAFSKDMDTHPLIDERV